MNPKHLVIIVPVALLIGCVGAPRRAPGSAETSAHSFGIYLVAFTADKPWGAATLGELATLPLAKEPVLSDADILSYDFASHQMLVRRGGLSRLPNPSVWGAPFVVVADGQRIYLGAFGTMLSSSSTSVPTILVDFRDLTNSLTIDSAYPGAAFAEGPDPRSDERIRVALAGLKKLKSPTTPSRPRHSDSRRPQATPGDSLRPRPVVLAGQKSSGRALSRPFEVAWLDQCPAGEGPGPDGSLW